MLQHLSIKHYALIERLEIQFEEQLNILTGETGSGKSIVLGAMGLLLGERADIRTVQEGKTKCIVEGTFVINGLGLEPLFAKNDLDYEPVTTIRREVLASGKSRTFVNDTPVNLKVLKAIGMRIIDIHSQHQTMQINDAAYQLGILDKYAATREALDTYQAAFAQYRSAQKALAAATSEDVEVRRNLDFIRFQLKELELAALDGLNQTELDEELNLLSNADEIAGGLGKALDALSEGEVNVRLSLRAAIDGLAPLKGYARHFEELQDRLRSAEIELNDVSSEVSALLDKVEVDPERLAKLEALQGNLFRLEQKHGVQGVEALTALRDDLRRQVLEVDNFDERIAALKRDAQNALADVEKQGKVLRTRRQAHIEGFCKEIVSLLKFLNMPQARMSVVLEPLEEPGSQGLDRANFFFTANAGHKLAPLREVASGGELSRLMLAIKHISVKGSSRSTIVFDEIDTGVSGEVAHSMGRIMKGMSQGLQVICITHLPQIAAKGNAHYKVYKEIKEGRTVANITRLDESERVQEIAQMLSGANTTDAALANARELLEME